MNRRRRLIFLTGVATPFYPDVIGGVTVGDAGTGFLANYNLMWGEDFDKLEIVGPNKPRGKWFTTKTYSPGSRGSDTALDTGYDTDPLMTGYLDSNRGVPVGFDNLSVADSVAKVQARPATSGAELDNIPSGRTNLMAVLFGPGVGHWYAGAQTTDDICYEARVRFTSGAPRGWHPTVWTLSLTPVIEYDSDECDFEGNSTGGYLKRNFWNTGTHTSSAGSAGVVDIYDGDWHNVALVMNTTFLRLYIDGVQTDTINSSANAKSKPAYPIISSHIFDGVYESEDYVQADWDAAPDGAQIDVDYIRIWSRASKTHYVPLVAFADQNVDYGDSVVIQLPTAAEIWGTAPTNEYLQVVPTEENSPDVTHSALFTQFPTGVSYDSGTRQITVDITSGNTGAMEFVLSAWETGGTGRPLRFRVNLGPNVTQADLAYAPGDTVDLDLYAACDVGILTPKTVTVSGLSGSGLSYDPDTGHLTGTAVAGDYTMTVEVTNRVGQTVSKDVAVTVATITSYADNFNRTSANLEATATASGGWDWTHDGAIAGGLAVSANLLSSGTTDSTGSAYFAPDLGSADHYVQYTPVSTTISVGPFICARLTDKNNFIGIRAGKSASNGQIEVYSRLAGTFANLYRSAAGALTVGDVLRLECSGTTWTLKQNGTQIATGTIDGSLTATKAGAVGRSVGGTFADNFEAGLL
jgi:hypothetical protein